MNYKKLWLEPIEFREGDLVLSENRKSFYLILEIKSTLIHNHRKIKRYDFTYKKNIWEMCEEFGNKKREVIRVV